MPAFKFVFALCLAAWLVPVSALADVFSDIVERGSVRIGVSAFVPWTVVKPDGELLGFEVDVGEKIAADMGVKAEFRVYEWDKIIDALQKGEIDMIAAGMAITPQRALKVAFSNPYFESGVTLAANIEATKAIDSLEALNQPQVTIVTVSGTLAHGVASRVFDQARLMVVATAAEAEEAVISGKAMGYVASVPEARFLSLTHPADVDLPLGKPLISSVAGFAVKIGEQNWLNFLNAWIASRQADKWLGSAYEYWFGTLSWQDEAGK
jgi:polar amino acid transport system substrate-binding protein